MVSKRIQVINLSVAGVHGQVHGDVLFGRICWSEDEERLVYVAESKSENKEGYFEKPFDDKQGDQFMYEESWGEQLTAVVDPVLCILTLQDESVTVVKGIPDDVSPLHPEFGPDNTLIFAGLKKVPFRLGAVFCENRECAIYQVKLGSKEKASNLTQHHTPSANYQPQVNLNLTKCIFLHRKLSGHGDTHRGSYSLMTYEFTTKSLKIV